MSKNQFREKPGKIIDENLEQIVNDGCDHTEDINRIISEFKYNAAKKERKRVPAAFKTVGIAAAMLAVLFVGSILLADVPAVSAMRADFQNFFDKIASPEIVVEDTGKIIHEYSSLAEAEADLGTLPITVGWLPDEYELSRIQVFTNNHDHSTIYSYDYFNPDKHPIGYTSITVEQPFGHGNISDSTFYATKESTIIENINGTDVAFREGSQYEAYFIFKNAYEISIFSDLDKNSIIKIIENIE